MTRSSRLSTAGSGNVNGARSSRQRFDARSTMSAVGRTSKVLWARSPIPSMPGTLTPLAGSASSAQRISAESARCEHPAGHDGADRCAAGPPANHRATPSAPPARGCALTTPINVEEIHQGLRDAERATAIGLFDGLRIAPIGRLEGVQAGDWRRDHASTGATLAQADCLIAAVAVAIGVPLATGNPKHFPMRELDVEHWPVGV